MQVVCPQCRSVYKAPDTLPPNTRFNCKKCKLTTTLGEILRAQQEQLYNSQLADSELAVVELDALPLPGSGVYPAPGSGSYPAQGSGSYPTQGSGVHQAPGSGVHQAPPQQPGLGFADEPQGGLGLADDGGLDVAGPPAAAPPGRPPSQRRGGGGLDLMDDPEEEEAPAAEEEDEWDELQPLPEPTLAEKLQPHTKNIVLVAVALVIFVGLYTFHNREDPREVQRRQMAQRRQQQEQQGGDTDTPGADPTPRASATVKPSQTPARDTGPTFEENFAELEALQDAGKYAEAGEFLGTMPMSHRDRIRGLRDLELNLEKLASFVAEAGPALAKVKEHRKDDPRLARHYVERVMAAHDNTVPDIPLGRELISIRAELAKEVPFLTGGIPPAEPLEHTPEREAALQAAREQALAQAKQLRERIDAEKTEREALHADEVKRAREVTTKSPLTLTLKRGIRVSNAVVQEFDSIGFKVRTGEGNVFAFEWDQVDPDAALEIRRQAVREDDVEDQIRFGYWCLRRRMFSRAGTAFREAAKLDPEVSHRLPDVSALRKASRVFHGDMELRGSTIEIKYDFDDPTQANDWEPEDRRVKHGVSDGAFNIQGSGVFLSMLREVGFKDRAELTAIPSTAGHGNNLGIVLGLGFDVGTPDETIYMVVAFIEARVLALYRLKDNKFEELSVKQNAIRGQRPRLRLRAIGNKISVSGGGKSISERIDSSWDNCRVYVGGAGQGAGDVAIGELEVEGQIRFSWLRKSFGEFEALLQGFLARAKKLSVFESETGAEDPPLSAEDDWARAQVDEDAWRTYVEVRDRVHGASDYDFEALIKSIDEVSDLIDDAPHFAAAYFLRAVCLTQLGSPALALPDIEQAIACCPAFHEAFAYKAILLSRLGRADEALAVAEQAVELRPDALSLLARGSLHFQATNLPAALADLEIARAMLPADADIVRLAQGVSHVVEGPGWIKKYTHETDHYKLDTNVPNGMDELATEMEVVRKYFIDEFGAEDMASVGKASVLMFDTEEGYHSYAELTTEDRGASTLGLYIPRYRQLLMFQDAADVDGVETRQTLFHEGFHQFMHQLVGDNLVPYWLNEGLAEYYSAVKLRNGRIVDKGLVLEGRLSNLKEFITANRGRIMPFEQLMQESPAQFYSGIVWAKYAQAWAMVHYFKHGASVADRERFERYVSLIRGGISGHDAFEAAWTEGVNWRNLERDFTEYVKRLN